MISFEISGELGMFQSTARDFARAELRPAGRSAEKARRPPDGLGAKFTELGLGVIDIPEVYGGLGQGLLARAIVEEELAFGDLGITLAMPSPGAAATAVLALGSDAERSLWLPRLVESGRRGAIAWSEARPKSGSFSVVAEETERGAWRLSGEKSEVVLGDEAALLVVFAEARARSGRVGPAAFCVPCAGPISGLSFSERAEGLGLLAAPTVSVSFDGVEVEGGARLSGAGERFDAEAAAMFARIGLLGAARAVGLAGAAFDFARDDAEERKAFGKPIAHFQGLAFLVSDMATRVEVMRSVVHRAAWAFDTAEPEAPLLAAMATAECHEGAMFVTNSAVQVLGGAGFVEDYPVEKWMRDAKAHMAHAMPHQVCDLMVGRVALEGGAASLREDGPMPEMQPVFL